MHAGFATHPHAVSHLRVEISRAGEGAGAVAHVGFTATLWHAVISRFLEPTRVLPVGVVGDSAAMELYIENGH